MERNTRQRIAIREAIEVARRPLLPQEVLDQAQSLAPGLGIATVYRNLARFRAEGAVQVIGCVDGEDRYDGNTAPHGHFICRTCGAVIDLPPIPVELPDMTAVGEADSCGVVFYGRCNGCLAEKKTS